MTEALRAIENLLAFLTECDHCCRDAVFVTLEGEQFCAECLEELEDKT
jgi:hypothetical protein